MLDTSAHRSSWCPCRRRPGLAAPERHLCLAQLCACAWWTYRWPSTSFLYDRLLVELVHNLSSCFLLRCGTEPCPPCQTFTPCRMGRGDPPTPPEGPAAHFQYSRPPRDRFWALLFLLTWLAVIGAGAYGVAHRWVGSQVGHGRSLMRHRMPPSGRSVHEFVLCSGFLFSHTWWGSPRCVSTAGCPPRRNPAALTTDYTDPASCPLAPGHGRGLLARLQVRCGCFAGGAGGPWCTCLRRATA